MRLWPRTAAQDFNPVYVRFGSGADITSPNKCPLRLPKRTYAIPSRYVRFVPLPDSSCLQSRCGRLRYADRLRRPRWRMASCISLPAVAHLAQAVGERRIAEIRKSAAAGRDVERSVAAVRHLSLPRSPAHRHRGLGHGSDALGDVPKAVDLAGCDVERPPAAMLDHAAYDFGHVIDQHVIAPLLAFAEQHDLLPCRRQPTEAVGPVAVVRIPL